MVSSATALAMFLTSNVWAVCGIVIPAEDPCAECWSNSVRRAGAEDATSMPFKSLSMAVRSTDQADQAQFVTSTLVTSSPSADPPSTTTSISSTTFASSLPQASTDMPTAELDIGVKIGIGVVVGCFVIAITVIVLEVCYMRRWRREKALRRAVQEVETGQREMSKGSQERIVLESRVSIVFQDADSEADVDEEVERGRNGMSLARRHY